MTDILTIRPITLREANAYVEANHRHHGPTRGWKFGMAVCDQEGAIRAVGMVGRPVARELDDGLTVEVLRVCSDGARNACSMIYGAARRAAQALGYKRVVTYLLASEPGTSLKASGWKKTATVRGRSWDTPSRRREVKTPAQLEDKTRWEVSL